MRMKTKIQMIYELQILYAKRRSIGIKTEAIENEIYFLKEGIKHIDINSAKEKRFWS